MENPGSSGCMAQKYVRLAVDPDVRELVRRQKREGDSYSEVLRKMAEQYDPDQSLR